MLNDTGMPGQLTAERFCLINLSNSIIYLSDKLKRVGSKDL